MNRYLSSEKWDKIGKGEYQSPDGQWQARKGNRCWNLFTRVTSDKLPYEWLSLSSFLTLADCQEWAEQANRALLVNETCGSCGADIGPSSSYPWHRANEDCRAVREPVV